MQVEMVSVSKRLRVWVITLAMLPLLAAPGFHPLRAQAGSATPPASLGVSADLPDELSEEDAEPILARLLITTDATARLVVDGVDLGILEPDDTLVHEVRLPSGSITAQSVGAAAPARFEKTYALAEEEADERQSPVVTEIEIQIKMAKAIRELRKKERQEGIFSDFKRGLMWRRADNLADVTWKAAGRYCDALDFAGWSDWRLPTIEELETLQAMWSQAAFKTIGLVTLSDCCPWSSTSIDDDSAWNYNFRYRRAFDGRKGFSFGLRALCVRALTQAEIDEHDEAIADRKKNKKKKGKVTADDEEDESILGTVDDLSDDPPPP